MRRDSIIIIITITISKVQRRRRSRVSGRVGATVLRYIIIIHACNVHTYIFICVRVRVFYRGKRARCTVIFVRRAGNRPRKSPVAREII